MHGQCTGKSKLCGMREPHGDRVKLSVLPISVCFRVEFRLQRSGVPTIGIRLGYGSGYGSGYGYFVFHCLRDARLGADPSGPAGRTLGMFGYFYISKEYFKRLPNLLHRAYVTLLPFSLARLCTLLCTPSRITIPFVRAITSTPFSHELACYHWQMSHPSLSTLSNQCS